MNILLRYFLNIFCVLLLCCSISIAQSNSIANIKVNKLHKKVGMVSGIIKNESNTAISFTNDISQKGLFISLHEIYEYPPPQNGKQKLYDYDMGQELQGYSVQLKKIDETTYVYKIYNVPIHKKFLLRCNTSKVDSKTAISTLASLNFVGAITYIVQKGFNASKYSELVNIINTENTILSKNIYIKN